MVTIKDVAKKAKVSVSTASRTLHTNGYVSASNKEAVIKAAEELGYVVNVNAAHLKQKNQNIVGFVLSDISNPYFTEFVKSLREELRRNSYDLLLTISNNDQEEESKQIKYLIGCKVSKILIIPSSSHNRSVLELARKNNIDVIQLFISVYKDIPSIVNNDSDGVYQAAYYLINKGYKRIGLLDVLFNPENFDTVFPRRNDGFLKAKEEHPTISFKTFPLITSSEFSEETKREISEYNPDAIIAGTGIFGLNTLKYLKDTSKNIKLVSFDNNEWLEYLGITSINQSKEKLLDEVVKMINSTDPIEPKHINIDESLILRD